MNAFPDTNLHIPVSLGESKNKVHGLIDTGCDPNIVQTNKLPQESRITSTSTPVCAASPLIPLTYHGNTTIKLDINGFEYHEPAKVVDEIDSEVILGMEFLVKHEAIIDCKEGEITLKDGNNLKMNPRYLEKLKQKTDSKIANYITLQRDIDIPGCSTATFTTERKTEGYRTPSNLLNKGITVKIDNISEGTEIKLINNRSKGTTLFKNTKIGEKTPRSEIINAMKSTEQKAVTEIPEFRGDEDIKDPNGTPIQINKNLKLSDRRKALALLYKYRHILTTKDDETSMAKVEPYKLTLKDCEPVQERPYNTSYKEREKVRDFLQSLETAGIIEKSRSEYCSPGFVKFKSNGKPRLLVNYKKLNNKLKDDHNTVPRIEVILEALQKAKYFSTMDLAHGYYQFPLHSDSQKYTAFRLDSTMLYEFKRLPQGMKNSAAATCRAMHDIFEDKLYQGLTIYIDDLCVYGQDFDTQLKNLEEILQRLERHNFKLNTSKCEFFEEKTTLLGHAISLGKIQPNKKNIEKFLEIKRPKTVKDVRSLISSFGFYRKFMEKFVDTAKPLMDLVSKTSNMQPNSKIEWNEECEKAFESLKKQITSAPVLEIYRPDRKIFLQTDASSYSVAAVLSQEIPETKEQKPVAFYSEKLPQRKRHLSSYDLELIGISKALKHFRQYLYMQPVTVLTDHKNLISPKITKNSLINPARMRRITDVLSQFDLKFEHIKGKDNHIPDLLSRGPDFEKINNIMAVLQQNKLVESQINDKEIRGIRLAVQGEQLGDEYSTEETQRILKASRRYEFDDKNVLCYKRFNRGKRTKLPMIPKNMREELIREVHDEPLKGNHTGELRTYLKLADIVSWPTLRKDVTEYVKTCEKCQKLKSTKIHYGKMNENKRTPELMSKLCTDVVGPFTIGNQKISILTMIDSFSKFMFMRALKEVNTQAIISLLNEIVAHFPAPRELFTDQATYFTSNELQAYCQEHGIDLTHAIAYTPSTNGLCERPNQWINVAVKAMLKDRKLASTIINNTRLIQRAWNTCPHPGMENKSPHYVMFGQEDKYLLNKFDIPQGNQINRDEELKQLNYFRMKIPKILKENFTKYSFYYNRNRKDIYLKEKDKVMLQKTFPTKMDDKFTGPYEITKVIGPSTCKVKDDDGNTKIIHVSKIKKYYEREKKD